MAFADPLKEEVCKACGVTRQYLEQHKDNFRLILQGWGTDFRRSQDQQYWVKKLAEMLHREVMSDKWDIIIFTDMRFENEYNFIIKTNGVVVRVIRDTGVVDNHPSELALDNARFHVTIDNNTTLDDLVLRVKDFLTKLNIPTKR